MKKSSLFFVTLCFYVSSWACLGPSNVSGVAFTNGEKFNLNLTAFGTEGVNYEVDIKKNGGTTVSYASHYDPKAMVFIGDAGISYQEEMRLKCMGVVYPQEQLLTLEPTYEEIRKEDFDFTAAIKAELEWLVECNILLIEKSAINSIISGFARSSNGGIQYWTLQKKALGYNSWYTYDDTTWIGIDVNGVKETPITVRETTCSGIDIPEYHSFVPVSVKKINNLSKNTQNYNFRIFGKSVRIEGLQHNQHLSGTVVSITGKVMSTFFVNGNSQNSIDLSNLAPGTYFLKCNNKGQAINKSVVIY